MLNGSLYADDLCHGADDVESAFNLSSDAVSILSDASFNLRKLHTNSKQLHDLWIQNGLCEENSFEKDNKLKVLGLVWNLEEDMLRVDVTSLLESFKFLENTKRSVLSTAAKVFDPVGFLSPFVVRIKRLMQEIWERGLDWDSKLPEDLESKWKKWCAEIEVLGEMKIERCYFSRVVGKLDSVEVHIFSDASIVAYGAVAYFRYVNFRGEVGTSFVMSKSRISPLKKLSLPRLELMGALIAARLWKYLSKVFCGLVDGVFLWTDSEICLCWIKGSAREWKQFVSNRVLEIQDCTSPDRWKFCPVWLRGNRNQWPRQKFERVTDEQKLEKLNTSVHAIHPQTEIILDENEFSNLGKLLRVTAWMKRFVAKLKKKTCESGTLSAAAIKEAEEYRVKRVQLENYCSDIQILKKNKPVPPHSKIYSLVPYVDDRGILRVKGRLEQAELFHNEKHPAILPKSKFTDLIIMSEHIKSFHSGVVSTLSRVRNNFWIPRGRQVVKKVISECLICKKCALKPAKQLTGQLPRDRVVESPPFAVVGIDFTGAITIKAGDQSCKKVPITYETNELGEPRCLTPSQFLLPGRDNSLPEHFLEIFNKVVDRETLTRRKLYQSRLLKQLWTKWKDQYLLQLRTAHNFTNPSSERNLKSGDIVLVEGPKKSKLLWDMGVVEQVIVGRDGHVRACIVRTPKGQLRRAVQLLYPFEI
ncbi:reverse transcriptase [Caerostris darwini]|uniref:Reverse transcriptase n=1 Tax=Caerostris darwini TaxID=1538125 RepID=A0AAV4UFG8_9ARAC|nr:reverse transcriptase [Caerostris darwini]